MIWADAFKLMRAGEKIKLPSWGGYWYWDSYLNTIMMHTKDNQKLDIRDTQFVEYTFENVASDEWMIADESNTPILGADKVEFDFSTALKYMKRGLKVYRRSWYHNDKYKNVEYAIIKNDRIKLYRDFNIPLCQSDLLAQDWTFYEE